MEDNVYYKLSDEQIENKTKIIVGYDNIRAQLRKITDMKFRQCDDAKRRFLDIHGNILLYGKPGTGKTSMCYELVDYATKEYGASCYQLNLSNFISEKLGKSARNISMFFDEIIEEAQKYKLVLLIEEIEAFLVNREFSKDLEDMKRVLITFMQYLDRDIKNLMIISTTNYVNNLDDAIKRRFDFKFEVEGIEKQDVSKFLSSEKNPFHDKFNDTKILDEMGCFIESSGMTIADLKYCMRSIYLEYHDVSAQNLLHKIKEENVCRQK